MTTRRLVGAPTSTAPKAARVRKLGTAAVPTTASVLLRRKMRRVMDIRRLLALSLLALGFDPYGCPVDCGRGLEPKAKSQKPRAISSETPANRVAGLRLCSHPGDAARRRA